MGKRKCRLRGKGRGLNSLVNWIIRWLIDTSRRGWGLTCVLVAETERVELFVGHFLGRKEGKQLAYRRNQSIKQTNKPNSEQFPQLCMER